MKRSLNSIFLASWWVVFVIPLKAASAASAPIKTGETLNAGGSDIQSTTYHLQTSIGGFGGLQHSVRYATAPGFNVVSHPVSLDIDGNGKPDALTDGLIIARTLAGMTDSALTGNVVSDDCRRCDFESIAAYLGQLSMFEMLDVDDDNNETAGIDGMLILRYLFGFRGAALVDGLLDGAPCSRCLAPDLESFLNVINTVRHNVFYRGVVDITASIPEAVPPFVYVIEPENVNHPNFKIGLKGVNATVELELNVASQDGAPRIVKGRLTKETTETQVPPFTRTWVFLRVESIGF